jgi:hypothetical protein
VPSFYLYRNSSEWLCRVYSFPELSKVHEFATHEKEVDDLHFSPDSAWVASISKDRSHRSLNMELDLQVLFGLLCTAVLIG